MSMEARLREAEGLLDQQAADFTRVRPPAFEQDLEHLQALAEYDSLARLGAARNDGMEDALRNLAEHKRKLLGDAEAAGFLKPNQRARLDRYNTLTYTEPTQAAKEAMSRDLAEAVLREELTTEDLAPFRTAVAYRIVRLLLTLSGRAEPDETLMQALPNLDAWDTPIRRLDAYPHTKHHLLGPIALAIPFMGGYCPLPLVNPSGATGENLEQFVDVARRGLGLDRGSRLSPASGRLGLHRLVEHWPSPFELVQYEQDLLMNVHNAMAARGRLPTRNAVLVAGLGYTPHEADELIARSGHIATRYARGRDVGRDREYIVERVEGIADRCREALDTRGELNAAKQIALATGINQNDSLNDDDFEWHESLEAEEQNTRPQQKAEKTLGPAPTQE